MDNDIKDIRLKFNCPADWDSMPAVEGGRFCNQCHKMVYDFSDTRQEIFLKILAENSGNICGRFRQEQMARVIVKIPIWKKWASAAMVLIGINVFNNKVEAQTIKNKQVKAKVVETPDIVVGMVNQVEPKFPGGNDVFVKFLANNLCYTKGMKDGRVLASFIVNKNGSLSNIKILKSVSVLNDNEVVRVLKLSPKWIPAQENNKPVALEYAIPVKFDSGGVKK